MWHRAVLKQYFRNVLIGIDQLINCFFLGAPDETMSSRLARYKDNPYGRPFYLAVNWVFEHIFRWPNHCEDSKEPDDRHNDEVLK